MQTDLPPPPPAIRDTAERTATPGSLQTVYRQVNIDPYQETIQREAKSREANVFLFGDGNHRYPEIWEFYFSSLNINTLHDQGVKVMAAEIPTYVQVLAEEFYKGKIDSTIFESILASEFLTQDINKIPAEDLLRKAKAVAKGAEYAKSLGIKLLFVEENSKNFDVPQRYEGFKKVFYDRLTSTLRSLSSSMMTPDNLINTYYNVQNFVIGRVLPDEQRLALGLAVNPNARADAIKVVERLASPKEENALIAARYKEDPAIADKLRKAASQAKGGVSLLIGAGHLIRPNTPGQKRKESDIDGALLKSGMKVLTTILVSARQFPDFKNHAERRAFAHHNFESISSIHGLTFLGTATETFTRADSPAIAAQQHFNFDR